MEQTFAKWIRNEIAAGHCALLTVYEKRDTLLYIQLPQLEKAYMEAVGEFENMVIREELECELLQKKQQMIQVALNRREPIDEAAIDARLEEERQKLLKEAVGDSPPREYVELSTEDSDELQTLYREIVRGFHPQMHPELSDTHRELFQKAQEAYRRKDLKSLRLVHQMLMGTDDGMSLEEIAQLLNMLQGAGGGQDKKEPTQEYMTDYTIAKQIYAAFAPTQEEVALIWECERCQRELKEIMAQMDEVRQSFPYSAAEMLQEPAAIEKYRQELTLRMQNAQREQQQRRQEISRMLKRTHTYG